MHEYAKIVRAMIEHENALLNARLTWLLTLQAMLFAGLAFVWQKYVGMTLLLCSLGMLTCLSLGVYLRCSIRAIQGLERLWEERRAKGPAYDGPPVIGLGGEAVKRLTHAVLPWNLLPLVFFTAWFVILALTIS